MKTTKFFDEEEPRKSFKRKNDELLDVVKNFQRKKMSYDEKSRSKPKLFTYSTSKGGCDNDDDDDEEGGEEKDGDSINSDNTFGDEIDDDDDDDDNIGGGGGSIDDDEDDDDDYKNFDNDKSSEIMKRGEKYCLIEEQEDYKFINALAGCLSEEPISLYRNNQINIIIKKKQLMSNQGKSLNHSISRFNKKKLKLHRFLDSVNRENEKIKNNYLLVKDLVDIGYSIVFGSRPNSSGIKNWSKPIPTLKNTICFREIWKIRDLINKINKTEKDIKSLFKFNFDYIYKTDSYLSRVRINLDSDTDSFLYHELFKNITLYDVIGEDNLERIIREGSKIHRPRNNKIFGNNGDDDDDVLWKFYKASPMLDIHDNNMYGVINNDQKLRVYIEENLGKNYSIKKQTKKLRNVLRDFFISEWIDFHIKRSDQNYNHVKIEKKEYQTNTWPENIINSDILTNDFELFSKILDLVEEKLIDNQVKFLDELNEFMVSDNVVTIDNERIFSLSVKTNHDTKDNSSKNLLNIETLIHNEYFKKSFLRNRFIDDGTENEEKNDELKPKLEKPVKREKVKKEDVKVKKEKKEDEEEEEEQEQEEEEEEEEQEEEEQEEGEEEEEDNEQKEEKDEKKNEDKKGIFSQQHNLRLQQEKYRLYLKSLRSFNYEYQKKNDLFSTKTTTTTTTTTTTVLAGISKFYLFAYYHFFLYSYQKIITEKIKTILEKKEIIDQKIKNQIEKLEKLENDTNVDKNDSSVDVIETTAEIQSAIIECFKKVITYCHHSISGLTLNIIYQEQSFTSGFSNLFASFVANYISTKRKENKKNSSAYVNKLAIKQETRKKIDLMTELQKYRYIEGIGLVNSLVKKDSNKINMSNDRKNTKDFYNISIF